MRTAAGVKWQEVSVQPGRTRGVPPDPAAALLINVNPILVAVVAGLLLRTGFPAGWPSGASSRSAGLQ